jgi:hypothetical protein
MRTRKTPGRFASGVRFRLGSQRPRVPILNFRIFRPGGYAKHYSDGHERTVARGIIDEQDGSRRVAHVAAEVMAKAKPLAAHGGDRKSERPDDQGSDRTLKRGEGADYLAARIKRDRPDIAERVQAGEFSRRLEDPRRSD